MSGAFAASILMTSFLSRTSAAISSSTLPLVAPLSRAMSPLNLS
ncbi:MAG TPA: hypothetical protein PKE00_05025 [Planctomycetota bacterium]|nr:hypothetical protein [Planctomycetota bacterium]